MSHKTPASKPRWMLSLFLILTALLPSCAAIPKASDQPALVIAQSCPQPVQFAYADALQLRAADELDTLNPKACPRDTVDATCSAVRRYVSDYKLVRAQIRTTGKAQTP